MYGILKWENILPFNSKIYRKKIVTFNVHFCQSSEIPKQIKMMKSASFLFGECELLKTSGILLEYGEGV